jgi:hypothetical protein
MGRFIRSGRAILCGDREKGEDTAAVCISLQVAVIVMPGGQLLKLPL